ncbi:dephospho-CoA kinase [Paracidobacterium acidisoli]|uniref:Dephospho-CoA kinase n=1 Tax=Paracidobacterium acidisoli TaxID=2303751 RepID=A0A372INU6_9BACT|nr:dephospho-CoA kinase [Paracidobacterium acidisoli]MBT9332103.1 dephospho-CoA kinase [Paracidobacterium acidisoli]
MLRVGLTGGLGSGKSTVASIFRECGVHVIEADAVGRELMQPGQSVYREILEHFGHDVLSTDGTIDRRALAKAAFGEARLDELNRIVHPAVIAEQERRMRIIASREPEAIVMIESALIFEAERMGTVPEWRRRFDRIILVTAPDEVKVARYLARVLPADASIEQRAETERDAQARLAAQIADSEKISHCDYVIENSGSPEHLRAQVGKILPQLQAVSKAASAPDGLQAARRI